jgi:hypothetical protein
VPEARDGVSGAGTGDRFAASAWIDAGCHPGIYKGETSVNETDSMAQTPMPGPPPPYWLPARPARQVRTQTVLIVVGAFAVLVITVAGIVLWVIQPTSDRALETKVAVSRSAAGQFTLYVLTCPGEWIKQASLVLITDNADNNYEITLWEIRSPARTSASQFTVGESPPGFQTVTQRAMPPVKGRYGLSAQIIVNDGHYFSTYFYPGDARRGSWYLQVGNYFDANSPSGGSYVSLAKFGSVRKLVCDHQDLPQRGDP